MYLLCSLSGEGTTVFVWTNIVWDRQKTKAPFGICRKSLPVDLNFLWMDLSHLVHKSRGYLHLDDVCQSLSNADHWFVSAITTTLSVSVQEFEASLCGESTWVDRRLSAAQLSTKSLKRFTLRVLSEKKRGLFGCLFIWQIMLMGVKMHQPCFMM